MTASHDNDTIQRLPDARLTTTGGDPVMLIPPRCPGIIVALVHPDGCGKCATFIEGLAAAADELRSWDACIRIVRIARSARSVAGDSTDSPTQIHGDSGHRPAQPIVPGSDRDPPHDEPFPVLHDEAGRLAAALGDDAGVIIADEWGEIHALMAATSSHAWPETDEIVSWARYLATRCPECEGEAL